LNAITSIALALACVFVVHWLRTRGQIPGPFEDFSTIRGGERSWRYEEGGVVVSDLRIEDDHDGLPYTAPEASVTIANSSDSPQSVAVHIALYRRSAGLKLLASSCLKAGDTGVVQPGTTVTPVAVLPVPKGDMNVVWWVAIRVTRTKVTR
jgi:hypothetical protein